MSELSLHTFPCSSFVPVLFAVKSYGNDVIRGNHYLQGGALKTWVDYDITLPAGKLVNATVFIHQDFEDELPFRLQIWVPNEPATVNFTLYYEYRVSLSRDEGPFPVSTALYTFVFLLHEIISLAQS